jgi:hypothetical protein
MSHLLCALQFCAQKYQHDLFDKIYPYLENLSPVTLPSAIRCFPHLEPTDASGVVQVELIG